MEAITQLFELDIIFLLTGIFTILSAIVSITTLLGKFSQIIGKPFRWVKSKDKDLLLVSEKIDFLCSQIEDMQQKMDETEMAKLKNSIVAYYKKYKASGEWSRLESEAFWELFQRYEAHGGNGYVHSIIEPAMRELDIHD